MRQRSALIGPSEVRAPAVSTCWSERSACASGQHLGGHYFAYINLLTLVTLVVLTAVIQNHRRGCRRVSNFCMGP